MTRCGFSCANQSARQSRCWSMMAAISASLDPMRKSPGAIHTISALSIVFTCVAFADDGTFGPSRLPHTEPAPDFDRNGSDTMMMSSNSIREDIIIIAGSPSAGSPGTAAGYGFRVTVTAAVGTTGRRRKAFGAMHVWRKEDFHLRHPFPKSQTTVTDFTPIVKFPDERIVQRHYSRKWRKMACTEQGRRQP